MSGACPTLTPAAAVSRERNRHNPAVRAMQIVEESGPEGALALVDAPEPGSADTLTGAEGVVVDVHAAGVSFPELLQTRGEYQVKPELPFIPGCEIVGVVPEAPAHSGWQMP